MPPKKRPNLGPNAAGESTPGDGDDAARITSANDANRDNDHGQNSRTDPTLTGGNIICENCENCEMRTTKKKNKRRELLRELIAIYSLSKKKKGTYKRMDCEQPYLSFHFSERLLRAQTALRPTIQHLANSIMDLPDEDWTTGLVESHFETLQSYWSDFTNNHVRLLTRNEDRSHEYFQANEYNMAEATYLTAKGYLYDLRARVLGTSTTSVEIHNGPSPSTGQTTDCHNASNRRRRLPNIELPRFNGTIADWESFRDLFRSLVHEDPNITDVERLWYLKGCVSGEAATALQSIQVTNHTYETAWKALTDRYENKRVLIRAHIVALCNQQPLNESPIELQTMVDELNLHRNQLASLGQPIDNWDSWIVTIASQRLSHLSRQQWEEELSLADQTANATYPSLEKLIGFVNRRCLTLKALESRPILIPSREGLKGVNERIRPLRTCATTKQSDTFSESRFSCGKCGDQHYIGHCSDFQRLSVKDRRSLASMKQLCFNCLKSGHGARSCTSKSVCRHCGAAHHTLLHESPERQSRTECPVPFKRRQITVAATQCTTSPEELATADTSGEWETVNSS